MKRLIVENQEVHDEVGVSGSFYNTQSNIFHPLEVEVVLDTRYRVIFSCATGGTYIVSSTFPYQDWSSAVQIMRHPHTSTKCM